MTSTIPDCELIVAGGGPTGLLTAYLCAEAGIAVRLFEANAKLAKDLRATSFHPPTLDMLEPLGITELLIKRGLVCPSWQIRIHPSGERAVFELATIADETRHPFRLQCEQWKLAEELLRRLTNHPNADLRLAHRVIGFAEDSGGVTATVEGGTGTETVRGRFLVGADGLKSDVRRGLGIPFEGETYPEATVVVTTPFRFEDHLEGLSMVTSCWTPDSHIAFLRLPDFWRLALYPNETLPIEEQATFEAVQRVLHEVLEASLPDHPPPQSPDQVRGGEGVPITAIWTYRVQQRIAATYRRGRVALVGDAAHVNSPAGGMGLNAGIHDAFELALALKDMLRGGAGLERLDLYDRRRRPIVAEHILGQSARNRGRMRVTDPAKRREELAALQAIAADPVKHKAFVLRASMIDGLRQAAATG